LRARNRGKVKLFGDKPAREQVEPFLTGEAFSCFFSLIYELEFTLKLFLGLVFNALVLGTEIDLSLPFAYVGAFGTLLLMQWALQKPISRAYLENQRMNNRVTAQGYTAWDNVFSGNRYNLRLWFGGFKSRLREALTAQIRAIVAREGMNAMSGIVSLGIVFATITFVAVQDVGDTTLLIALATTLPRQIEMTYELHLLASGWNDFVAVWTRLGGVAANMLPKPDPDFDRRIKFDRLVLREGDRANVVSSVNDALRIVQAQSTGRINIRGGNGTGKSSLLASLKTELRQRAFYWPPPTASPSGSSAASCQSMSRAMTPRKSSSPNRSTRSSDSPPASASSNRSRRSSTIPMRGFICSTNGTPISTPPTRPRPTPWSMRSPPARASSKSRTATARRSGLERNRFRLNRLAYYLF
jgi:hypothetical protein